MPKRDLSFVIAAAAITAIFLTPTLKNLGLYGKIPSPPIVIFVVFPIVAIVGMLVAYMLGKGMKILWQLAKFGLVGVMNTTIDFGILNFLVSLTGTTSGAGIVPLNLTSFGAATINSYFWNKSWVFDKSKKSNFISFFVVSLIGIGINSGLVYVMTTYVPPVIVHSPVLWANLAKIIATFASLVWNFLGYKLVVFKK